MCPFSRYLLLALSCLVACFSRADAQLYRIDFTAVEEKLPAEAQQMPDGSPIAGPMTDGKIPMGAKVLGTATVYTEAWQNFECEVSLGNQRLHIKGQASAARDGQCMLQYSGGFYTEKNNDRLGWNYSNNWDCKLGERFTVLASAGQRSSEPAGWLAALLRRPLREYYLRTGFSIVVTEVPKENLETPTVRFGQRSNSR